MRPRCKTLDGKSGRGSRFWRFVGPSLLVLGFSADILAYLIVGAYHGGLLFLPLGILGTRIATSEGPDDFVRGLVVGVLGLFLVVATTILIVQLPRSPWNVGGAILLIVLRSVCILTVSWKSSSNRNSR